MNRMDFGVCGSARCDLPRRAAFAVAGITLALAAGTAHAQERNCNDYKATRDTAWAALELEDARNANEMYIACLRAQEIREVARGLPNVEADRLVSVEVKRAEIATAAAASKAIAAQQKFQGINFGVGLGYSFGLGDERVETADVVNNLVRVKSDVTDQPRLVLELHTYVWNWKRANSALVGIGPFASIQTAKGESGGDTLSSFGLGLMVGIQDDAGTPTGWNLGFGYVYDSNVQVLGDGIEDGQPLPSGETEVRFKRKSEGAVMVMFSRQFATLASSD